MCYKWWHHNPLFPLQQGARQGDRILAYVLILYLEILFVLIKNDRNIKGIEIFEYCCLYRRHNLLIKRQKFHCSSF